MRCEMCYEDSEELTPYEIDNGVLHICEFCIEDLQDAEDEPITRAMHSAAVLNSIRR